MFINKSQHILYIVAHTIIYFNEFIAIAAHNFLHSLSSWSGKPCSHHEARNHISLGLNSSPTYWAVHEGRRDRGVRLAEGRAGGGIPHERGGLEGRWAESGDNFERKRRRSEEKETTWTTKWFVDNCINSLLYWFLCLLLCSTYSSASGRTQHDHYNSRERQDHNAMAAQHCDATFRDQQYVQQSFKCTIHLKTDINPDLSSLNALRRLGRLEPLRPELRQWSPQGPREILLGRELHLTTGAGEGLWSGTVSGGEGWF